MWRPPLSRGVFDAYTRLNLRYSQLAPLSMWEEVNTGSNLPAQVEIYADTTPGHDVLDHRPGVEVLEVQDFLVPVGVGDLEEPVLVGLGVHPLDDRVDHRVDRAVR